LLKSINFFSQAQSFRNETSYCLYWNIC